MGSWYRVIKTIKGRRYAYDQRTWREAGKVRCQSRYVGPAGGDGGGLSGGINTTGEDEAALIDKLFDHRTYIGVELPWGVRWSEPYQTRLRFKVPEVVLRLPLAMGVSARSRAWEGDKDDEVPDGAWHDWEKDEMQLPDMSRFADVADYVGVVLHECAHATRMPWRLDREQWCFYEEEEYAHEELVAELTAHLVAHRLGLPRVSDAAGAKYICGYLAWCSDRDDARVYAEREAKRAADYLVSVIEDMPEVNTTRRAAE